MKCQNLLSGKNKKKTQKNINLSSVELAQRVVKVNNLKRPVFRSRSRSRTWYFSYDGQAGVQASLSCALIGWTCTWLVKLWPFVHKYPVKVFYLHFYDQLWQWGCHLNWDIWLSWIGYTSQQWLKALMGHHGCTSLTEPSLFALLWPEVWLPRSFVILHIGNSGLGTSFYGKVVIFFLFLHKNICCGYSLEAPHGASNEYHTIWFPGEIRRLLCGYPSYLDLGNNIQVIA